MLPSDAALWSEQLQQALAAYDEPLLREVAGKLVRARGQWPAEDLARRCEEAIVTPTVIDRRLKALGPAARQLLALIGHSRQGRWPVGSLVEMNVALGQADGLEPVLALLQAGLLYPAIGATRGRLRDFESWLAQAAPASLRVFAHPAVAAQALGENLDLPELAKEGHKQPVPSVAYPIQEADGLEWPLRLAVLWQQVKACPLRRTQQGDFFKRDLDRLRTDPILGAAPADGPLELPDLPLFTVALGLADGVLLEREGELHAGVLPAAWDEGLAPALASLWQSLLLVDCWDADEGWQPSARLGNPYPAAWLLALLLLARLPEESWARPEAVAGCLAAHHPYWAVRRAEGSLKNAGPCLPSASLRTSCERFLLGLAYQLRLVLAARDEQGSWLVRLSPLGRWVLGVGPRPEVAGFAQTLLVQPNLEILAYRQGMTPGLAARLGRFAAWKSLGAACTLQLRPDTVYAALEAGETFETILQALAQHGTREVPTAVVQLLKSWSTKRERISVYPAATLFEFATPEDLEDALARGLPGVRLSDRLAAVAGEAEVDFRHYRLTATRDYTLPPERCVTVEPDGVTFTLDPGRADLLLESEVQRFAEPAERENAGGRRQYRLTPASAAAGRAAGLTVPALETWFQQRSGQPLPPAARLLLAETPGQPPELRRRLVLHVASPEVADGLQQWPGTRALIEERLGPIALVVTEEHAALLQERLAELGIMLAGKRPARLAGAAVNGLP